MLVLVGTHPALIRQYNISEGMPGYIAGEQRLVLQALQFLDFPSWNFMDSLIIWHTLHRKQKMCVFNAAQCQKKLIFPYFLSWLTEKAEYVFWFHSWDKLYSLEVAFSVYNEPIESPPQHTHLMSATWKRVHRLTITQWMVTKGHRGTHHIP